MVHLDILEGFVHVVHEAAGEHLFDGDLDVIVADLESVDEEDHGVVAIKHETQVEP
jgi:hypothetical protein